MALTEERFMELMTQMTEKQNIDLEKRLASQLDSIRIEMSSAIKSISDRQDSMELEQKGLLEQLGQLQKQMTDMQNCVEMLTSPDSVPSYSSVTSAVRLDDHANESETEKREFSLDLGRRTIGFQPFEQEDIDAEFKRGARDENEAKVWAVQNFLRYEMNIKQHVFETFNLEKIFSPDKEDWNVLYMFPLGHTQGVV
jgi:hypothetical protein